MFKWGRKGQGTKLSGWGKTCVCSELTWKTIFIWRAPGLKHTVLWTQLGWSVQHPLCNFKREWLEALSDIKYKAPTFQRNFSEDVKISLHILSRVHCSAGLRYRLSWPKYTYEWFSFVRKFLTEHAFSKKQRTEKSIMKLSLLVRGAGGHIEKDD